MALQMLAAYYSRGCDSAELSGGFQIEEDVSFGEHLNQYDVIYLNMQQFLIEAEPGKVTEYLEREVLEELREEYGNILSEHVRGLAAALRKIYARTDRQFVFLIDEWDCVMRILKASEKLLEDTLRGDEKSVADVVFLPLPHTDKPALVVELKYDKDAETAIKQIRERCYTQALEGYSGEVSLAGIHYDKEKKAHSCVIEKREKR